MNQNLRVNMVLNKNGDRICRDFFASFFHCGTLSYVCKNIELKCDT